MGEMIGLGLINLQIRLVYQLDETQPDHRKRGTGRQVVAAWVRDISESGRVPFYSFRLRNSPSAALASSIHVEWFANVIAFERVNSKGVNDHYRLCEFDIAADTASIPVNYWVSRNGNKKEWNHGADIPHNLSGSRAFKKTGDISG